MGPVREWASPIVVVALPSSVEDSPTPRIQVSQLLCSTSYSQAVENPITALVVVVVVTMLEGSDVLRAIDTIEPTGMQVNDLLTPLSAELVGVGVSATLKLPLELTYHLLLSSPAYAQWLEKANDQDSKTLAELLDNCVDLYLRWDKTHSTTLDNAVIQKKLGKALFDVPSSAFYASLDHIQGHYSNHHACAVLKWLNLLPTPMSDTSIRQLVSSNTIFANVPLQICKMMVKNSNLQMGHAIEKYMGILVKAVDLKRRSSHGGYPDGQSGSKRGCHFLCFTDKANHGQQRKQREKMNDSWTQNQHESLVVQALGILEVTNKVHEVGESKLGVNDTRFLLGMCVIAATAKDSQDGDMTSEFTVEYVTVAQAKSLPAQWARLQAENDDTSAVDKKQHVPLSSLESVPSPVDTPSSG